MREQLREAAYKTTEFGLIPEDWSITTLSKVGSFLKGKGIKKDEVQTDGIPCVRYGELYTKYDNIITFFHSYINEEVASSSIQIKEGDILFAGSGETKEEIGKCAALLFVGRVYASGDIVVLRPNNFDSTFLGYLLNAPIIAKQKSIRGQGDAVVHIYSSGLANVKIPVPPPAEQKAIATALSDVDTLITNLDKLIAKKKAIKQGAMQRLLKSPAQGGQRLPGFEGEWIKVKLGDIGDCIIGLTYSPSNVRDNGTLVLRSSNIQNGRLALEDNVYVQMDIPQKLITQVGDILICVRNGSRNLIGKCLRIDERVSGESFGAFMSIYRTKYSEYISQAFQSNIIQKQIEANLGATINQITNKTLNSFEISIPEEEKEIEAIASILSDMDKEIESLETKKSKYLRIKQGMMQELLTGKTRLNH